MKKMPRVGLPIQKTPSKASPTRYPFVSIWLYVCIGFVGAFLLCQFYASSLQTPSSRHASGRGPTLSYMGVGPSFVLGMWNLDVYCLLMGWALVFVLCFPKGKCWVELSFSGQWHKKDFATIGNSHPSLINLTFFFTYGGD